MFKKLIWQFAVSCFLVIHEKFAPFHKFFITLIFSRAFRYDSYSLVASKRIPIAFKIFVDKSSRSSPQNCFGSFSKAAKLGASEVGLFLTLRTGIPIKSRPNWNSCVSANS